MYSQRSGASSDAERFAAMRHEHLRMRTPRHAVTHWITEA